MKVFDCFKFFNELELLDLRLMELNDVVDYFVLAEANKTHTGKPKEFIFENNKHLFKEYLHKIIHIKVYDLPDYSPDDIWRAENFQRNALGRALVSMAEDGDKIIVSDVDEIPNVELIKANLENTEWVTFRQDLFYYYVNCQQNCYWDGPIMANYGTFRCTQELRASARLIDGGKNAQPNGGWHYSFMGGPERIRTKVENIAESHLIIDKVGTPEEIKEKILHQKDLWGRSDSYAQKAIVDISHNAPRTIEKFITKYPHFLYSGRGG